MRASILLLALAPHWFSAAGQWLIGAVAFAVAALAVAQWIGLRRLDGDALPGSLRAPAR